MNAKTPENRLLNALGKNSHPLFGADTDLPIQQDLASLKELKFTGAIVLDEDIAEGFLSSADMRVSCPRQTRTRIVANFHNGELHDPADGSPAWVEVSAAGIKIAHANVGQIIGRPIVHSRTQADAAEGARAIFHASPKRSVSEALGIPPLAKPTL